MKDDEWSGLLKIPDSILLKEYRIEIGKLKSYITELEESLNTKDNYKMYEGNISQLKEKLYYKKLRKEISDLQIKNSKYKRENEKLICQIAQSWKK
jgi:hypothetical protein